MKGATMRGHWGWRAVWTLVFAGLSGSVGAMPPPGLTQVPHHHKRPRYRPRSRSRTNRAVSRYRFLAMEYDVESAVSGLTDTTKRVAQTTGLSTQFRLLSGALRSQGMRITSRVRALKVVGVRDLAVMGSSKGRPERNARIDGDVFWVLGHIVLPSEACCRPDKAKIWVQVFGFNAFGLFGRVASLTLVKSYRWTSKSDMVLPVAVMVSGAGLTPGAYAVRLALVVDDKTKTTKERWAKFTVSSVDRRITVGSINGNLRKSARDISIQASIDRDPSGRDKGIVRVKFAVDSSIYRPGLKAVIETMVCFAPDSSGNCVTMFRYMVPVKPGWNHLGSKSLTGADLSVVTAVRRTSDILVTVAVPGRGKILWHGMTLRRRVGDRWWR